MLEFIFHQNTGEGRKFGYGQTRYAQVLLVEACPNGLVEKMLIYGKIKDKESGNKERKKERKTIGKIWKKTTTKGNKTT